MRHTALDFEGRREAILAVLALQAPRALLDPYVADNQLRLLDRIETAMRETLLREGLPPEEAAQIALHFVANTVANYRTHNAAGVT